MARKRAPRETQTDAAWAKRAALADRRALRALRTGGTTRDPLAADVVRRAKRRAADARRKGREPSDRFAKAAQKGAAKRPPRPAPKRPPPRIGPRHEYVARVDYSSRKHGSRVVELRIVPPDGRRASEAEVKRAVLDLARGFDLPDGWSYHGLTYGRTREHARSSAQRARGGRLSPDELGGLLGLASHLTVGEASEDDE